MKERALARGIIIAVLVFMMAGFGTAAAIIIPPKAAPPDLTIVSQDDTQITLRIDFHGFTASQVEENGQTFQVLEIPDCGKMGELGQPAIPFFGTEIAVPDAQQYLLDILDSQKTTLDGAYLYPAQEPGDDAAIDYFPPFPTPPFYIDEAFYQVDQFTPYSVVSLGPAGTLRGVHVLPVKFSGFRFNPVSGQLEVYSSITAKITFSQEPGPIIKVASSPGGDPYFEGMYSGLVGYQPAAVVRSAGIESDGNGADFLIVSDQALKPAADTLAARRNAEGLVTRVVTTVDTGMTADQIKAYIQNAYDTWSPKPSYLLLLGDADLIPTFYHTVHSDAGSYYPATFHTGTDLYYSILNGPEAAPPYFSEYWTPDLFTGRIPVHTLAEAQNVVDKITDYEDNQWANGEKGVTVAAYFQDDDLNGYEDRRFVLTSEEIRDFLTGEGFTVDQLYTTKAAVNPTHYNNGDYESGLAIPASLTRPTFPWNSGTADITTAINAGRFTVFHRDHGGSLNRPSSPIEGWGDPEYQDTDVPGLTNSNHYCVIFSMNCETGWFDGETDEYASRSYESLSEAFLRADQAGAVGVVGATRISSSGWNDNLAKGFVDAIWPNYDTTRGSSTPLLRMGEVLNYGKWYMKNVGFPAFNMEKQEYEIFHYFGDPTMEFKIPVENIPPTANADGPYTATEGSPVHFDGSGSTDPDATPIASYEWDINNDGVFELTGVQPTYTWCDDYSSDITLKVTDTAGATGTDTATVTVTNVPPSLEPITLDQPTSQFILPGQALTFGGIFKDPGCDTWDFSWSFDDGTPDMTGTLTAVMPLTANHVFAAPGDYTITLVVTDDNGGTDSATLDVTVTDAAGAKHDLAAYIAGLPDTAFRGNAAQRRNALDNMFRALDKKLETGAYQGFIQDLRNNIRSKADGSGGDDWITDPAAQQEITGKIDAITAYVATLKK